ncbi:MAG TPA: hypothetical protein VIS73_06550 [Rhodocyclaceae bacterium]
MRQFLLNVATVLVLAACSHGPVDPVAGHLEAGEAVHLRVAATLMHGHDMQEPEWDSAQGYRLPPAYAGELLVTDRRLLFVNADPVELSIPYAAISRSRPSATPLLNYLIVWDHEGHPDSFVVDAADVKALHAGFARALYRARGRRMASPAGRPE